MIAWTTLLLGINIAAANPQSTGTYVTESIHAEEYARLNRVVNRTVRRIQRRRIMGSVVLVAHQDQIVYVIAEAGFIKKNVRRWRSIHYFGCIRCQSL